MHSSKNSGNFSAQSLRPGFWFQCAEQAVWKNGKGQTVGEKWTLLAGLCDFSPAERQQKQKKKIIYNILDQCPADCSVLPGWEWPLGPSNAVLWEGLKATTERLCLRNKKEFYELNCSVRKGKRGFRVPFIPDSGKLKKTGFSPQSPDQSQPVGWWWWSHYTTDAKKKFSPDFWG